MPENPIYSQSGGFQDSRDQRFIDESALGSMKEPVAASLKNIVENNPHLTQDPSLLGGLLIKTVLIQLKFLTLFNT